MDGGLALIGADVLLVDSSSSASFCDAQYCTVVVGLLVTKIGCPVGSHVGFIDGGVFIPTERHGVNA